MAVVGVIETQVAQTIENGFSLVCLITAEAVLVVVDHGIGTRVDEEAVCLHHPGGGQFVLLHTTMGNHHHIVGLPAGFLDSIILLDGVQRIGASRRWGGDAELMFGAVDDG